MRKKRIEFVLLFLLFFSSWFAPLIAKAQTDEITGRVVTKDGVGLPNVMVMVQAVTAEGYAEPGAGGLPFMGFTDEGGYFKFTELKPSRYHWVAVDNVKGHAFEPILVEGRRNPVYSRIGANITITMIKGGAITGRITNAKGGPVIGAFVWAAMVRDAKGKPIRGAVVGRRRITDDRGVYRLYGLTPGSYIVLTSSNIAGPFATDSSENVPTYHPSSTRETAAEVVITNGGETRGVDIRYREDRGRVISGEVIVPDTYVLLVSTGAGAEWNYIYPNNYSEQFAVHGLPARAIYINSSRQFAFRGLPDGEYLVVATDAGNKGGLTSEPRRISLRGSDATGIELKLLPLGSISGRVVVESSPGACESKDKIPLGEFSPLAIRDDLAKDGLAFLNFKWPGFPSPRANEKSEFTISYVNPGHYRIITRTRLSDEYHYVKAITLPAPIPTPSGAPAAVSNVSRDGLALKQGEKLDGVIVTIAEGAASVRGKVVAEKAGGRAPERLRAHLIPAESNAADDVLRYAEAPVYDDGAFAFKNIAPGKYWLMARAAPNEEPGDRPSTPIAWDANERAKLRSEAIAAKNEIELLPCQRVKDFVLRFIR